VLLLANDIIGQHWTLGRVESIHSSTDGLVHAASVKTTSGVVRRPIAKMCLLEVHGPTLLFDNMTVRCSLAFHAVVNGCDCVVLIPGGV
jgi:hypothetical protein